MSMSTLKIDGLRRRDVENVHVGDAGREVLGQDAEAAADLEHDVVGPQLGQPPDHLQQVRVDQEVLAQLAIGADAELAQAAQARLDWGRVGGVRAVGAISQVSGSSS